MAHQGLTAGKLAKAAQVNVETLRYYEKRELLPEPPRRESGYRVYPPSAVDRLQFIKGAQALGFTLEEIRGLLNLRVTETTTRQEVRRRAQQKLTAIEEKIQNLQAIKQALNQLIEQCHTAAGPDSECPILEGIPKFGVA